MYVCRSRFNSEKRCSLSYANIQGKEALVEKFRNSTVMDEPPSYRPMLFYSSGPHVGEQQVHEKSMRVSVYVLTHLFMLF